MLSEASQTEKDKYFWFHLHSESKKQNKWTNNKIKTCIKTEQTSGHQTGGMGVGVGETGEGD